MQRLQRRLCFCLFAVAVVPLLAASAAFACQRTATLSANPRSGPVGTVVALSGGNYSGAATSSPVEVHLNTRTGPVIASGRANADGTFSASFTVDSSMAVGYHTLIATQTLANGTAASGTPGRTSFQVTSATGATSAGSFSPTTTLGLPIPVGAALATLLGGLIFVGRRRRLASSAA